MTMNQPSSAYTSIGKCKSNKGLKSNLGYLLYTTQHHMANFFYCDDRKELNSKRRNDF